MAKYYASIREKDLPNILAQIVTFTYDNYYPDLPEEDVLMTCAHICACFVAQHAPNGNMGVETDFTYVSLKINEPMDFEDRWKLATKFVDDFS